ncbi:MAG: BREX-2 system adenine-specific DNA-methyltransferase PglX, partial [Actinobacteria bacterium]|nr:BREX-2 system adenine-specific DNA-methyltransferase PglX [Actinomycetota bacterium]
YWLHDRVKRLGVFGMTNADEVMLAPLASWIRCTGTSHFIRPLLLGDEIRDWSISADTYSFFPYTADLRLVSLDDVGSLAHRLWPNRTTMGNRATFSKGTYFSEGRPWYGWHQLTSDPGGHTWFITYAFVATHNHFVLDRGGKVFKQSAPVIKLPEGTSEDDHLALLGVLNSSTACFWLKQVCHDKGSQGVNEGFKSQEWERFFEFTGTKLQEFPLPAVLPHDLGRVLDGLAHQLAGWEPRSVSNAARPDRVAFDAARGEQERIRGRMIALQEELDWHVYGSYGLLPEGEIGQLTVKDLGTVPEVKLGERAFEIMLARKVAAEEVETAWFARHGCIPVTEIPAHWPEGYRRIVQARIDIIGKSRNIALIERPECKRRWATEPWEKREKQALRSWLLDRCEDPNLWFTRREGVKHPRTLTVNQLADQFRTDEDMHSVAALYAADHLGKRDLTLAQVLAEIVADEHVPYLAALRYKDTGLRKRAEWEQV